MVETIQQSASTPAQTALAAAIKRGRLADVCLHDIVMGNNPRGYRDDSEQQELNRSVGVSGVMTAILLRDLGNGKYEIIAGERRYHAAMFNFGIDYLIPASIFEMDDVEAYQAAVVENVVRADMSPAEESVAAAQLLATFAGDRDEVCRRLGLERGVLDRRLALMNASETVLKALTHRRILLGHAELLAAVTKAKQDGVLQKLLALPKLPSVADCKVMVAGIARPLDSACFEKSECTTCPHNSDLQQAMFSESIGSGNCTNGDCYSAKTETELAVRKASLVETFPRVEIVREGDNYTVIKLVVDGSRGVGEEQAKACRGCANFGAAISAVPGKEGKVFEDQCFDTPCNTRMVARNIRATAAAASAADPASSAVESKKADTKSAGKAAAGRKAVKAKASAISPSVLEYRKKVWRTALRTELASSPRKSIEMLIAICLASSARNVVASEVDKEKVPGLGGNDIHDDLVAMSTAEGGAISATVASIALTALETLQDQQVKDALRAYEVDLTKTFAVSADYFGLITKSEITAIAKEIGLDTAYGSGFAKLLGGKKDDAIKALMAVQGFNYHVVPGQISYL